MTEPTTLSEPTDNDASPTDTIPEDDVRQNVAPEPDPSPNSEAARWRTKLRETEAERDTFIERLTAYQRRECEAAVSDLLDEHADLFEIGQANVTDFYNDDGTLNVDELLGAAAALCDMRPKLAKPRGPRWQNFGQGSKPPPPPRLGWDSVLKGYIKSDVGQTVGPGQHQTLGPGAQAAQLQVSADLP
jgi:hypothetical protein